MAVHPSPQPAAEHLNSRRLDGGTESDFPQIRGGPQIFQNRSPSAGLHESAGVFLRLWSSAEVIREEEAAQGTVPPPSSPADEGSSALPPEVGRVVLHEPFPIPAAGGPASPPFQRPHRGLCGHFKPGVLTHAATAHHCRPHQPIQTVRAHARCYGTRSVRINSSGERGEQNGLRQREILHSRLRAGPAG